MSLPTFQIPASPTTAAITALPDCQKEFDERRLRIDRVGIKGLRHPLQVTDRSGIVQPTVATLTLTVDLPADVKGTHMSRFVEVLNTHGHALAVDALAPLVHEVQRKLGSHSAHLEIEFPYFVNKSAPVTGIKGLVDYEVKISAALIGRELSQTLTLKVPVTTLCPCSKAISDYGAHNQRGYVTLALRSRQPVWIEEAISLIEESASSQIYSLLKRPDEKFVTERAYENPVFVEDLVRNVALRCNHHAGITWYRVEAENMESIHNHAAYACIENEVDFEQEDARS